MINKFQITFCLIIAMILLSGCKPRSERIRDTLMYSHDHVEIIRACFEILEDKISDTSLIKPLLTNIVDERISDSFYYLGQDVYSARLNALRFISGLECYHFTKRFPEIDLHVVDCYLNYAIGKGYIASKSEINLIHPYIKKITSFDSFKESLVNRNQVDWLEKYRWPDPPRHGVLHN